MMTYRLYLIIPDTTRPLMIEFVFILIDHSSLNMYRPYQYCQNQQQGNDIELYPLRKHRQIRHILDFLFTSYLFLLSFVLYPNHNIVLSIRSGTT